MRGAEASSIAKMKKAPPARASPLHFVVQPSTIFRRRPFCLHLVDTISSKHQICEERND